MSKQDEWIDAGSWIGRQQAFAIIANKCTAAQAQCVKAARAAQVHTKLGISWDDFCTSHLGISRATADRIIQHLDEFGEAYFRISNLARISPEAYRQIASTIDPETDTINIQGEPVAITPDNAAAIRAHVTSLRNQLRRERERTDPSLQELSARLDHLSSELSGRVSYTMPTVLQSYVRDMALRGAREFARIAKEVERYMTPPASPTP